jgi:hypothetical protein
MLIFKQRRPAIRTLQGWAISVLQEVGAIHKCEEHGWMQERADSHARERALAVAGEHPPHGVSSEGAVAAVHEVLVPIGDVCSERSPVLNPYRNSEQSGAELGFTPV